MKPSTNQARRKRAFTIVELLTVMSIIVILIGLLVPALNRARRYATYVKQKAQLHSMDSAIELFNNEYEGYPPSGALDSSGSPYCGAMKLCEALMGQDLLGFHSNSSFLRSGLSASGSVLYPPNFSSLSDAERAAALTARKGPYLPAESANAWRMQDIYGTNVAPFLGTSRVLCDVYERQMKTGNKTGMPILYYKADTTSTQHNPALSMTASNSGGNIYNWLDNNELVRLGKPWMDGTTTHNLATTPPERFYANTQSDKITTTSRPFRPDQYLLISAGWDNEYGTADDVCNFEWKYDDDLTNNVWQ
ncbi:MAG TPA: type II secretion system protein [Sedimentisphaerales bacterium]|nr:type II secretion system protein [Sedimentisphaerales bacterium]HNU30203.1 type II secretion system protein [Sedimentisphaerales bacterium]